MGALLQWSRAQLDMPEKPLTQISSLSGCGPSGSPRMAQPHSLARPQLASPGPASHLAREAVHDAALPPGVVSLDPAGQVISHALSCGRLENHLHLTNPSASQTHYRGLFCSPFASHRAAGPGAQGGHGPPISRPFLQSGALPCAAPWSGATSKPGQPLLPGMHGAAFLAAGNQRRKVGSCKAASSGHGSQLTAPILTGHSSSGGRQQR